MKLQHIYLAGFDVFRPDAMERGAYLKDLCRERELVGLYPCDGDPPKGLSPHETASWICNANLGLIRDCDAVMANLNDFRGPGEPDVGTSFEVGYAVALNKPVWAYRSENRTLRERVTAREDGDVALCSNGYMVEDFGLPVNLMLACTVRLVIGDAADCLDAIQRARMDFR